LILDAEYCYIRFEVPNKGLRYVMGIILTLVN